MFPYLHAPLSVGFQEQRCLVMIGCFNLGTLKISFSRSAQREPIAVHTYAVEVCTSSSTKDLPNHTWNLVSYHRPSSLASAIKSWVKFSEWLIETWISILQRSQVFGVRIRRMPIDCQETAVCLTCHHAGVGETPNMSSVLFFLSMLLGKMKVKFSF